MRSPRFAIPALLVLFCALLTLNGCSDEQIRIARDGLAAAKKAEAIAVAALEAVRQNAAEARILAEQIGGEKGAALMAKVEAALPKVEEGVKSAQAAVAMAETAVAAAEKEHAAGGTTIDVLVAGLLATVGGGGGLLALAARAVGRWKTATKLASSYADAVETSDTDDEVLVVKESAKQAQQAAGVHDLIQSARGKAA